MANENYIVLLGVFMADCSFRADRSPRMGETIKGNAFKLGPGGKGSNQAAAAARLGATTHFITKLGQDAFADLAQQMWNWAGVKPAVAIDPNQSTGAAYIFVEEATGNNAIIICPGVAESISTTDVEENRALIEGASVFVTQLEQSMDAAQRGLEIARGAGVRTILNPAPAAALPSEILPLCDFVTPNETEAEALCGMEVTNNESAHAAAGRLLDMGAGGVIVTLGENGAYYRDAKQAFHVGAMNAGPVAETTGAGDAFNGGFAVALSRGMEGEEAVRFAIATASISVTRPGTAPSMPDLGEVQALLASS